MDYINRQIEPLIFQTLKRGKSILLLGARQTGKTTLISNLAKQYPVAFSLSFIQPAVRIRYEQNPSLLAGEIEAIAEKSRAQPLVVIDEVQKVPEILDVVQDLIDRRIAAFILTGSSARKLRMGTKVNLLPGRIVAYRLDPFTYHELYSCQMTLEDMLLYGSLPGIVLDGEKGDKEIDLNAYVTTYLEEEIRAEALVRNVGMFARFIALAASESGNIVNFTKLSQEIGIAHTTIAAYYQILEDCLIAERVEPLVHTKTRRKLIKSPKYLFFDLGVRRSSADEGIKLPLEHLGKLFEQWVGLELIRNARFAPLKTKIYFWRDANGVEVDWVIEKDGVYIPIEVKWTSQPTMSDIKHLQIFNAEYTAVEAAYLVCQVPRKIKLAEKIYALPWQALAELAS